MILDVVAGQPFDLTEADGVDCLLALKCVHKAVAMMVVAAALKATPAGDGVKGHCAEVLDGLQRVCSLLGKGEATAATSVLQVMHDDLCDKKDGDLCAAPLPVNYT